MTPALAAPLFVASITLMLLASAVFARRLDHIGLRLGLPEALLGLLTALAADAPEVSSAIAALVQHEHAVAVGVVVGSNAFNLAAMLGVSAVVAGRVRARHETLELEAFVGLRLPGGMLVVLAVLTSLPNAWTGVRFGLQQRGSALMSETLNSNSINIVAGLAVPAALGTLAAFSGLAIFDIAWLIGMTAAALVLFGKRGGGGRGAGAFLIVLYAVFLAVQFARLA